MVGRADGDGDLIFNAWLEALKKASAQSGGRKYVSPFAKYALDPVGFGKEILGHRYWEGQEAIMRALVEHKKVCVRSTRKSGKALALDTPIPTPGGWTTMGQLSVGDEIFDETGEVCRVTFATEVQLGRKCFSVKFDDGEQIIADADHRWMTWTKAARAAVSRGRRTSRTPETRPQVRTTAGILRTMFVGPELNHSIPNAAPLRCPEADLPIEPYLLGAWLGDGTSCRADITIGDNDADEMISMLAASGARVRGQRKRRPGARCVTYSIGDRSVGGRAEVGEGELYPKLKSLGVLNDKHIPHEYLRASEGQRRALLAGLLDTDGYVSLPKGHVEFTSTRRCLSEGVAELARSLGFKPRIKVARAKLNGRDCGEKFRVFWTPREQVFRLKRKAIRIRPESGGAWTTTGHRRIVAVDEVPSVPVRCIQVDSPSSLFLAGRSMVPTHNTFAAADIAVSFVCTAPTIVICTAPGERQVRELLFAKLRAAHARARVKLPGERGIQSLRIDDDWFVLGVAASDPENVLGFHAGIEFPDEEGVLKEDQNPEQKRESVLEAMNRVRARDETQRLLIIFDEACHDAQTEVMSERGWVRFDRLLPSERLMTMDPATGVAEYVAPLRIVRRHHSGDMVQYKSSRMDFCVTPDHRMAWHSSHWHGNRQNFSGMKFCPMSELMGRRAHSYFPDGFRWEVNDADAFTLPAFVGPRKSFRELALPMDDWMRFLGWYCSEGHILRQKGAAVGCGISQLDKAVVEEIFDLCSRLGFNPKRYSSGRQGVTAIHIHSMQLGAWLESLGQSCIERKMPDCVRMASRRQIELFLTSYVRGDGYRKGRSDVIYTSSPAMADGLQELIMKAGFRSTVRRRSLAGKRAWIVDHWARSSVDGYVVTRFRSSKRPRFNASSAKTVRFSGEVWCASLPRHHLLLTRRGGCALWSGNCGIDQQIFDALEGSMSGENVYALMIANPRMSSDSGHAYANAFRDGSGWHRIHIAAEEPRNDAVKSDQCFHEVPEHMLPKKWIEERRVQWGEESPLFYSDVLGCFSDAALDSQIVPMHVLEGAIKWDIYDDERPSSRHIGCDLAGGETAGADYCVATLWINGVLSCVHRWKSPDTMHSLSLLEALAERWGPNGQRIPWANIHVDATSIGKPVVDRFRQKGLFIDAVNFGAKARYDWKSVTGEMKFRDRKSELYWIMRRVLQEGIASIPRKYNEVWRELQWHTHKMVSRGGDNALAIVEDKKLLREKYGHSPDFADAAVIGWSRSSVRPMFRLVNPGSLIGRP